VVAINGVVDEKEFLLEIGAKEVISIEEATDTSGKPLLKGLWAGGIDTIGGDILATIIKSTKNDGGVTCCGNVGSHELPLNVYPFILRGVTLMGIDSQNCPMPLREKTWQKIATDWKLEHLELLTTEVPLEGLNERIDLVLDKKHKARTIVQLPD
jgi:putative YhdH/YhfP family quinone oxidoreductase